MRLNNTTDRGEWRTHSSIYNGALITITAKMSTLEVWLGSECDSAQAFCRKPATLRALRALRALRLTCSRVSRASCLTWSHTSSVSCLTCSRALRDLLPHMPHMCLVLYFSRVLRPLVSQVLRVSCALCSTCSCALRVSPASCFAFFIWQYHLTFSPIVFAYLMWLFLFISNSRAFWGNLLQLK